MEDAPRIQERHVDVRVTLLRQRYRPEEDYPTYYGDRARMGRILDLAGSQLRPISFAHPEVPEERAVERSLFVTHKNGAKLPPRQRS
jgi:hypothetical protein